MEPICILLLNGFVAGSTTNLWPPTLGPVLRVTYFPRLSDPIWSSWSQGGLSWNLASHRNGPPLATCFSLWSVIIIWLLFCPSVSSMGRRRGFPVCRAVHRHVTIPGAELSLGVSSEERGCRSTLTAGLGAQSCGRFSLRTVCLRR